MEWFTSLFDSSDDEDGKPKPRAERRNSSSSEDNEDAGAIKYSFASEAVKEQDDEELERERQQNGRKKSVFGSVFQKEAVREVQTRPVEDFAFSVKEQKRKEALQTAMSNLYFGINDFQVLKTIGTGSFSRVKLIRHEGSGRLFAAKQMAKVELVRLKVVEHVQREKDILITFINRCQFVVQLETYFHDDRWLYLVTEFVPGGELYTCIQTKDDRRCSVFSAQFYMVQLVLVVEELHTRGIVHRDLKPENVVIDKDGFIKLCDFGFAKCIGNDPTARTHTSLGTPEYMAPECIQAVGHGKAVDLWCLGVMLFEMLTGTTPFNEEDPFETYQKILRLNYEFPGFLWMAVAGKDLISSLLQLNPENRLGQPSFRALKEHSFFSSPPAVNWTAFEDRTASVASADLPDIDSNDPAKHFMDIPDVEEGYGDLDDKLDAKFFTNF